MDERFICLEKLLIGEKAYIVNINLEDRLKLRLLELGFTKGSTVVALHKSPSGGTTAYGIRGTVIGLRNDESRRIMILKEVSYENLHSAEQAAAKSL